MDHLRSAFQCSFFRSNRIQSLTLWDQTFNLVIALIRLDNIII